MQWKDSLNYGFLTKSENNVPGGGAMLSSAERQAPAHPCQLDGPTVALGGSDGVSSFHRP